MQIFRHSVAMPGSTTGVSFGSNDRGTSFDLSCCVDLPRLQDVPRDITSGRGAMTPVQPTRTATRECDRLEGLRDLARNTLK